jgi:hypothetical protein
MGRLYNRARDPAAFRILAGDDVSGSLDSLRGHKYAVLVSFRRTGEPVPSPIWVAVDTQGRAYVQTGRASGKVKRIRNNSQVLIAASTARGKPTGPVLSGTARVLPKEEWAHSETTLASNFGLGRWLYLRAFRTSDDALAYVEITPRDAS